MTTPLIPSGVRGLFVVPQAYDPVMNEFAGREPPGYENLDIDNVTWPTNYKTVPRREPIPVQVRLMWIPRAMKREHAYEEWIDGQAVAWTSTHVCVAIDDPRSVWDEPWVLAGDVRRR